MSPLHLTPDSSVKKAKGLMVVLYPLWNRSIDLSVKSVVLILVERSPIYQQLMGKYVLDVQLDMKRAAVKTLYALMIEIECITRESRTSDTLLSFSDSL